MRRARRTLDSGLSILIFPEGTRSRDGAMRPFKPGAFRLARDTGRPILPVIISGTWDIMPPGKLGLAGRAWAIVEVQDPEYVVADTPEELQAEMQRIREKMIRRKAELDEETSMKLEKWERRLVRK